MKFVIFTILFIISSGLFATTHQCQVYATIQRYDSATMKFKSATVVTSPWFVVTSQPHEDQKDVSIEGKYGVVGSAKVWTGTLLDTSEGDLLQAHAVFTIEEANGSASLIMSLDSSLAKSSVVLEAANDTEFLLIPVDLKCKRASI